MLGDKFNIGDIMGLMKNANKIQDKVQEAQRKLANTLITGESGAGAVKLIMTAENYAQRIEIDPEILKEEKAIMEELIVAAINDAAEKIKKAKENLMNPADLLGEVLSKKDEK